MMVPDGLSGQTQLTRVILGEILTTHRTNATTIDRHFEPARALFLRKMAIDGQVFFKLG